MCTMRNSIFATAAGTVSLLAFLGCASESSDASEANATSEKTKIEAIREVAAADVEADHIVFPAGTEAPKGSPSSGYRSPKGPSLYGVDWFQKWPGGVSADHDWSKGTEIGKRCMWAANLRFEAIMKNPPAELVAFLAEYTKWSGSFYNWVNDYSKPESSGDARAPSLWSWRTGLSKWISEAAKDGSCYLPTRSMVVKYVATCKAYAAEHNSEMQGCEE